MTELGRKDSLLTLIACMGNWLVANVTWWIQPILIAQLVSVKGFSASGAGLIVSCEMAAMAVTSYTVSRFIKRGPFLWIAAVGLAIALAGAVVSLVIGSFYGLLLARIVTGIGEGFSYMVANTALVWFKDRERAFAQLNLANVLLGALLVAVLPLLPLIGNGLSGFLMVGIVLAVCAVPVLLMPRKIRLLAPPTVTSAGASALTREAAMRISLLAAATFLIALSSAIMWTFFGLIGQQAGLTEAGVNSAIAVSILAAFGGSSLSAFLGGKSGRLVPTSVGIALLAGAVATLSFHPSAWAFRISVSILVAMLFFVMPYFFASGSVQEPSGRGAVVVGSAFLFTGAIGPYVGGVLFDTVGLEYVGGAVVITSFIAWLLFAYVDRRTPRAFEQPTVLQSMSV